MMRKRFGLRRKSLKDKPKRTMTVDTDRKLYWKIEITNNAQPKIMSSD
jgi:hypothetical protein